MSTKFSWELRPLDGSVDFGEELNAQLPLLVRKLLAQRGISGRERALRFLKPRLADLGDPFALREMDAAVERIFRAADNGEHVCIYGDYDVDGVSSVTLLYAVLQAYGIRTDYFIPVRTREGYGLSEEGMANAMSICGGKPDLLIAVDCGTSSVEEVAWLQEQGVDALMSACVEMLSHRVERQTYRIPLAESRIIAIMHRDGKVLSTEYGGNDAIVEAILPREFAARIASYRV